jgi:hypothetical protein
LVEGTKLFTDFVELNLLPLSRRGHCAREYRHAKGSFAKLILPHVDVELMKKAQATDWLTSEDGSGILPPDLRGQDGGQRLLGPGPGAPRP